MDREMREMKRVRENEVEREQQRGRWKERKEENSCGAHSCEERNREEEREKRKK